MVTRREVAPVPAAYDDACLRLADALRRPPGEVEEALAQVGVDAPYLANALVDGDPQGAIAAVSTHLGVPRRDLAHALMRTFDVRPPERAAPEEARQMRDLLGRKLPRMMDAVAAISLLAGLALAATAALAYLDPDLFRRLLVIGAATLLALLALGALLAAWRLHQAARRLRRHHARR